MKLILNTSVMNMKCIQKKSQLICLEVCHDSGLALPCRMLEDNFGVQRSRFKRKKKTTPQQRNILRLFEMRNHLWVPISCSTGQEDPTLAKHLRPPGKVALADSRCSTAEAFQRRHLWSSCPCGITESSINSL